MKELVPLEVVSQKILLIRSRKVMLDGDLAKLYGVSTKRLNEQVKRNVRRFPENFMFQLSEAEALALRSQNATSKVKRGSRRYRPFVFTEQGVSMLSSVLNSERAIQVNIAIMRIFVKLRQTLEAHKELARQLEALERRVGKHDEEIEAIFEAIRQLMAPPSAKPKGPIGFGA